MGSCKIITYHEKDNSTKIQQSSEIDIINMLELLIDNIFVMFGGRVFQ
jgi:hypothetical protein